MAGVRDETDFAFGAAMRPLHDDGLALVSGAGIRASLITHASQQSDRKTHDTAKPQKTSLPIVHDGPSNLPQLHASG